MNRWHVRDTTVCERVTSHHPFIYMYMVQFGYMYSHMKVWTESATPSKSTKSRNSNSSDQIRIQPNFRFVLVPRDIEEVEFLDLMDFEEVALSAEWVMLVTWMIHKCGVLSQRWCMHTVLCVTSRIHHGVALVSSFLWIPGLFCTRAL